MINIELVVRKLFKVKVITKNLNESINQMIKYIDESIEAYKLLKELGLLDLIPVATTIKTWKIMNLYVTLDIPWHQQTMARHLYGGCFPESVNRDVIVENQCSKAVVLRRYRFKIDESDVYIRFYRDTFSGDKVDGCTIEYRYPTRREYYEPVATPGYHSISCPMGKGNR